MISFIRGKLVDVDEYIVTLDVGGVGYSIMSTATVINTLPVKGAEVLLYTYLYVREDNICLYGFESKEALNLFKMLINVNGIGPKGAIGILSTLTPNQLMFAVLSDDAKAISKAPGIGAKTAAKAILELKDKINMNEVSLGLVTDSDQDTASASVDNDVVHDTVLAMTALGYSNSQALAAVKACKVTKATTSDELLKLALKEVLKLGY